MKRPWTDEELAIVRRLAPTKPISHVARLLDRSYNGVRGAARKLRVKFNEHHPAHAASHPWRTPISLKGRLIASRKAG